jgi:hypothetical protein
MTVLLRTLCTGLALAGFSAAARAQETKAATYASLQKDGFEIRSTTYIPLDEVKRDSPAATAGFVYVTLEKGEQTAVCSFAWQKWFFLAEATVNAELCQMR